MAARYQYDEGGLYFYYFMASVTGLVVAPWTYYTLTGGKEVPKGALRPAAFAGCRLSVFGPRPCNIAEKKSEHWECNCEACEKKRVVLEKAETAKPRISWT